MPLKWVYTVNQDRSFSSNAKHLPFQFYKPEKGLFSVDLEWALEATTRRDVSPGSTRFASFYGVFLCVCVCFFFFFFFFFFSFLLENLPICFLVLLVYPFRDIGLIRLQRQKSPLHKQKGLKG